MSSISFTILLLSETNISGPLATNMTPMTLFSVTLSRIFLSSCVLPSQVFLSLFFSQLPIFDTFLLLHLLNLPHYVILSVTTFRRSHHLNKPLTIKGYFLS